MKKYKEKLLIDLYQKKPSITAVAKEYCKICNLGYNDSRRRHISRILNTLGVVNNPNRIEDTKDFKEAQSNKLKKNKYYIITWEQNETPLHKPFWENILAYKDYLGAELCVILGRYKNPTSVFVDVKHENWNEETRPYWHASRLNIHKDLDIVAELKTSPSTKYPLTGAQSLTTHKSLIIGHPKLHMNSMPVIQGKHEKKLFTTGAITKPNYTDSKIGVISHANHKYGFVIVEIDGRDNFYIRQVEALPDGSFTDLYHKVSNKKVTKNNKALALICGDTHHNHLDPEIDRMNDFLCKEFNVDHLVLHDVFDGTSCNRYTDKSPIQKAIRALNNEWDIEKEVKRLTKWLSRKLKYNPVIVHSNHNVRLDNSLENDWRKDVFNSLFYLKYTSLVIKGQVPKGVLAYILEEKFGGSIKCLGPNESFRVGKYECGLHGDWGANGAKGTPKGFKAMEIPMILAHSHAPYRADDCIYVGTNTPLVLDYNKKGMSSWGQCNILIYESGIAQQIHFHKGKFTTFKM